MFLINRIFTNKPLIDWNESDNIEFYRQLTQQNIIDKIFNLTFTFNNNKIEKNDDKKIIIDIGSGYSKWLIKFIKKYKNSINMFSIYSYDINDVLGEYLKEFVDIENREKQEIIELGLYCIYKRKDLKKDKIDFPDNSVFFIYQRDMIIVYNLNEWIHVINEIHRVLKKGGKCEFVDYDFIIKNVENNSMTDIINKYVKKKVLNINCIFDKINKTFNNVKYKIIKIPLYNESKFNGVCIENIILYYTHFIEYIIKNLKKRYNIILTYNEIISLLISEWEINKSYIELYFISMEK